MSALRNLQPLYALSELSLGAIKAKSHIPHPSASSISDGLLWPDCTGAAAMLGFASVTRGQSSLLDRLAIGSSRIMRVAQVGQVERPLWGSTSRRTGL